jgi:glycosyltransferase involved in cell wall biosynthesis
MKILLLSNLFVPFARGGAERLVELQAKILTEACNDVLVLSTTPTGQLSSATLECGARVRRFTPRNLYHTLNDAHQPFWKRILWHVTDLFSKQAEEIVRGAIESEKPDLVITHNMKGFGLSGFDAVRKSGVSHIHVLHDLQLVVPSGLKIFGNEKSWIASGFLQKWYVRQVAKKLGSPRLVVSPSQYLLNEHRNAGLFPESKTIVVQNPAPWDELCFKSINLSQTPLVLYVGQLEEHKGLKVLMGAWDDSIGANLAIIGGGSLEDEVKKFADARNSVTCYGRKSPSEVCTFMSRANLLVVPSLCYENSPTVVMEALSVGTPIVASRIGGIPELVSENDWEGKLAEPGNAQALREAIRLELARPLDREKIKKSAERFSVATYRKKLLELIEPFISPPLTESGK